jgi:endogenous inhibitor of DNA gyrase (YacG/DUF329 family)
MMETKSEKPFADNAGGSPAKPCPICGKPAVFATRPFCSKRCADIDLHRWLGGVYAIPAAASATGDADADAEAEGVDANEN